MHHFVINLIKTTAHQMQDFQLDKHQKTFGGRARGKDGEGEEGKPTQASNSKTAYGAK